ncbi:MAG: hypothetical protein ABEJ95_01605 [Candidatus Nanohalobium sp.]
MSKADKKQIYDYIKERTEKALLPVTMNDLKKEFDLSEKTIRKKRDQLRHQGKIVKALNKSMNGQEYYVPSLYDPEILLEDYNRLAGEIRKAVIEIREITYFKNPRKQDVADWIDRECNDLFKNTFDAARQKYGFEWYKPSEEEIENAKLKTQWLMKTSFRMHKNWHPLGNYDDERIEDEINADEPLIVAKNFAQDHSDLLDEFEVKDKMKDKSGVPKAALVEVPHRLRPFVDDNKFGVEIQPL